MSDIKSERWLWTKGILFLLIGLLCLILLMLEMKNAKHFALVVVTIWACCRAYYFAFYVIEKYIDPSFRFAGLLYLPQYMIRRSRRSETDASAGQQQKAGAVQSETPTMAWTTFWVTLFFISDLIIPGLLQELPSNGWTDWLLTIVLGAGAAQLAFFVIVLAHGSMPIRFRFPLVASGVSFSVLLVMLSASEDVANEVLLVYLVIVACLIALPATAFLVIRWLNGRRLIENSQAEFSSATAKSETLGDQQISIRYVMIAMFATALLVALSKLFSKELKRFLQDRDAWLALGCLAIMGFLIAILTQTLLVSLLSRVSKMGKLILLLVMSGAGAVLLSSPTLFRELGWFTPGGIQLTSSDVLWFLVGYTFVVVGFLVHARIQGIRYARV